MTIRSRYILLRIVFLLLSFTLGCGRHDADNAAEQHTTLLVEALKDQPLAAYQRELLVLAFETASAIPVKPHIKDRSRMQEKAAAACLELNQPFLAIGFIEHIDNWRRGSGYGDVAFYCAKNGYTDEALQYIDLADHASSSAEEWRKEHIKVKIANAYLMLGEPEKSAQYASGVENAVSGKVAGVRVMIAGEDHFEEQMDALDAWIESGNYDAIINALEACAKLFNRFYENKGWRMLAEEKLKASWEVLPVFKRIDLLMGLAGFALDHADQPKTLELVNETQSIIDSAQWRPEHYVSLMSRVSRLRYLAGDRQKAMADAGDILNFYNLQKEKIITIYRAGALLPLAEAYQAMGNTEEALQIYAMAIQEGVENPNSRPRAEDLSAACLSMALHGVEPDVELWGRIRGIKEGLGDPW
ncbi:hypothetical protein KsCSTR_44710 [Candidatus Kuenenia stuttgartiensis]|uniref:Uncharacterized protein n=1 Tax=Kuenenia stuttgartiensis TaxID=174633 RepID=A0A6G7GW64_KUEST|nr:hypothetical protein [Candidatus Kuenenia stuttgartiensis]QII13850.1 hypothetical protein KsCSTR_44710 [Candidatus Kuenenia stuttgartiensis]